MPVPSNISDLSKVPSENSPAGTESAKGTIDDYFRVAFAFIRQLSDLMAGPTVTLASAATVNIGFAASANISITGTTTINAFDSAAEGTLRWVTFAGALTLTHNAGSLQLPGAANIATTAGDVALFKSLGGGNWKCMGYQRVSGTGPVSADASRNGYLTAADWSLFNNKQQAGICLPMSGGVMSGGLTMNNNVGVFLKDTGGTARQFAYMDGSNNAIMTVAGGVTFRILSQDFSKQLLQIDNSGNVAQVGAQTQKVLGANATTRIAHHIQQADGIVRLQLVIEADESTSFLTYSTGGGYSGSVKFNAGGVAASGTVSGQVVTETSDERKKKCWRKLPGDLIGRLAGIKKSGVFQWKKGGAAAVGIGAQSLEAILPEAVYTDDKDGKTVNTGGAAMAIIPELCRELVRLRARLAKLEAR